MMDNSELERIIFGIKDELFSGGFLVAEPYPDYRLIYASPAMLAALGYDDLDELSTALSGSCTALLHPMDAARMMCGCSRCHGTDFRTHETTCRVLKKDGSFVRVTQRSRHITLSSGEDAIFASYSFMYNCDCDCDASAPHRARVADILPKESRQREAMLRALQAGEAASRAKAVFLSQMTRNIRTPLSAILELSEGAIDELDDKEKLAARLTGINLTGSFLLEVFDEIIDMSSIEGGRLRLAPDVYSYNMFSEYICDMTHPLCTQRHISFKWINDIPGPDIYVDIERFNQIFENILSNAIKYTPPGGSITFETANRRIEDGELGCDFIVSDTGVGMSHEFQKRMFAPFECDPSVTENVGTGLGLSITKQLVELMGGTIDVKSELGRGTTVRIHLSVPLAEGAEKLPSPFHSDAQAERNAARIAADGCGAHILVAEAERLEREIMRRMLEKSNYSVSCASNGAEAVAAFSSSDECFYSAILMDVRMPGLDGLDGLAAARAIRSLPRRDAKRIPIIAMATDAFGEDEREAREAGMNAYLVKPAEPAELFSALTRLTDGWLFQPTNMYKPT